MKAQLSFVWFFVIVLQAVGQQKELTVQRIDEPVIIDGTLDEKFWKTALVAEGFIQNSPVTGTDASSPTYVKVAYDNEAVYIGAEMFDQRDSMSLTLSQRDDFGNADWFGVVLDPYNAGTIGFDFLVTSAGVQIDQLHQVTDIDRNWNAVWKSAVSVENDRWVAELRIPFSALRFPDKKVQLWGVNFTRNIRRNRETSNWNFNDPKGINMISQLGVLHGIEEIESPLRLSFVPYVSGYLEHFEGGVSNSLNGGMDVKLGLNDAFTLDMTLIPDFGQVQFDKQVLNLTPFEVQFNENRQFFTEGTELFNKQNLFYSRRVGGEPIHKNRLVEELDSNETIIYNPTVTQLYNASKLSGRTKKGTGIGIFNALTAPMDAQVKDTLTNAIRLIETGPFSNYNVFVIDQNLKNNSSVTFTNTNVTRKGVVYDANVSALGGNLYTKGQKYNGNAFFAVSTIYAPDTLKLGYRTRAHIAKSAGNFLWKLMFQESNDKFDQNDLGFQLNNNTRSVNTKLNYNIFKPFGRFYRVWTSLEINYMQLVNPAEFSEFTVVAKANGTFRNFMTSGVWLETAPIKNKDWFEPRVKGRFYETDEYLGIGGFISSDYSKPFALDVSANTFVFDEVDRFKYYIEVSPRFRFSDKFLLIYTAINERAKNDEGVALTRFFNVTFDGEDPVFSKRNRLTVTNQLSANYIFTNRMGVTFSLRHYWSKVDYNSFFRLDENGRYATTTYTGFDINDNSLHNNSFNAFTIDLVYKWVFAPGSELSLVWKNSIFNSSSEVDQNYVDNLVELTNFPATNSLSFKMLYYIDYGAWHNRFFNREK